MYVTKSLWCVAEINILNKLYFNEKELKDLYKIV